MFTGGRVTNSLNIGIIDSNVKNLALRAGEKINDFCNGMKSLPVHKLVIAIFFYQEKMLKTACMSLK